jgi:hypothetical protein
VYSHFTRYVDWSKPFIKADRPDKYCSYIIKHHDVNKSLYLLRVAARSNNLFVTRHLLSEGKYVLGQENVYELYNIASDYKGVEVVKWYNDKYGHFLLKNTEFSTVDDYPVKFLMTDDCGDYKLFEYILNEGLFIPLKFRYIQKLLKKTRSVCRYKYIINTELRYESRCKNVEMLKIIDEEMPGILEIDHIGDITPDVGVLKWLVTKGYRNFNEKIKQYHNPNNYVSENLNKIVNYLKDNEEIRFDYNGKYSVCPISYMKSEYDEDDLILLEHEYSFNCSIIT